MSDQSYYWTPEWQAGERQAERELASGQVQTFTSVTAGLAWLMTEIDEQDVDLQDPEPDPDPVNPDNDPVPMPDVEEGEA